MKNMLKRLVEWMDRKWPDQVVVTLEDYTKTAKRLEILETVLAGLPERLKAIEAEINKFNVSLGFTGTKNPMSMMGSFQR